MALCDPARVSCGGGRLTLVALRKRLLALIVLSTLQGEKEDEDDPNLVVMRLMLVAVVVAYE